MNEGPFVHSIRLSYNLLNDLGCVRSFRLGVSLSLSKQFNNLALSKSAPYVDVFMAGLSLQHYNLLLTDFSYFQFSRMSHDEMRFAFYPSPFGPLEFEQIGRLTSQLDLDLLDIESYSYILESMGANPRRPLIRYEVSGKQYVPGTHPLSHIHFGTYGEDRWAVRRRLTPHAFALHVAKLYFSEHWEALTTHDGGVGRSNEFDKRYSVEKASCGIIDKDFFGPHEELQFHFL